MQVAMQCEREHGREPVDVSMKFLGYDIFSQGEGEVRHIEVKAFATTGDIKFTPHEWQMAQRLGDEYWLYVVEDALTEPKLTLIHDPLAKLPPPREVVEVVKLVVEDWKKGIGGESP